MSMTFSIRDYGARPDGVTVNTAALQAAIDACHQAGGGIVQCEAGVYLTGSVDLKTNVELRLAPGCTILGSTKVGDLKDFVSGGFRHERSPEGTCKYLIGASHAHNVAITGAGTINASGVGFYDQTDVRPNGKFARKPPERPRLLMLHKCTDVRIEDASFVDSPCWTIWMMLCERVHVHRAKILGDRRMINNDGIDVDGCRDVTISDCVIRTDDDCIVLRAIQHVHDTPAICENVTVTNCSLESDCQCVRVSCPSDHITRNCVFSNIVMKSRCNGINFDFPGRYVAPGSLGGAEVSNILFSNITIQCKAHPIRIAARDGVQVRVSGISFSNMRMESIYPCVIQGNERTVIEDISFSDLRIKNSGEQGIVCSDCRDVKFNNVQIDSVCAPEERTPHP